MKTSAVASEDPILQPRMPGLDVIRGVAILGVVIWHGIGESAPREFLDGWRRAVSVATSYGTYGVHLFFVLSGFLITGILLDTRDKKNYYRNFYYRRVLRIVPVYLLTLTILRSAGRISWGYLLIALAYLCNVAPVFHRSNEFGPLWSLSVEEQFYSVWPFLVRRLSLKTFTRLCILILTLSPLLRLTILLIHSPLRDIKYKTPFIMDAFAMGALLAIFLRSPWASRRRATVLASVLLSAGVVEWLFAGWNRFFPVAPASWMPAFELCPYIACFGGVLLMVLLHPEVAATWYGRRLRFLGEISYGLYLIHDMAYESYDFVAAHTRFAYVRGEFSTLTLRFVLGLTAAIVVATLSRRTFEAYFLSLKDRAASNPLAAKAHG